MLPKLNYQILFESLPGLYLILDKDLKIIAVSNAYLEATLTKREEILGRGIFEVFPENPNNPNDTGMQNVNASLQRVIATKVKDSMPVQKYDIPRPGSGGTVFEERFWSPYNVPFFDDDGEISYIIHRVEDVTEFVHLRQDSEASKENEELRDHAHKMELEVFLRSKEVAEANKKLHDTNNVLEEMYEKTKELDELKTNFFANISHELRTPLTLILGPVNKRLNSKNLAADEKHDLEVVKRNAQLLLKQVNDLLDISKLEAGKLKIEYAQVDLTRLLYLMASNFESFAKEREIDFSIQAPESLIGEVDIAKLQRILLNLFSNAFKFTPSKGRVEAKLEQINNQAIFSVSDSGPGIPQEMREIIFERFRQLDSSSRRRVGGTGLGLSIVKEFVALHEGNIVVSDGFEGGARFTITLPLKAPANIEVAKMEKNNQTESGEHFLTELNSQFSRIDETVPQTVSQGASVLIVEDNPDMRNFLTEMLGQLYRVETATNGREGLEKAIKSIPDLIVSDVMMPEMSGDEMARELLVHPETKDIPVLILTAKMDDQFKMTLLKEGVRDCISKPFSAEELCVKAERLIIERKKIIADRERLIQQLIKSNNDLEKFAYAAAHDLKSPLHSIDNLSQWLQEDLGESIIGKNKEYMTKLRQQVSRMKKLLDDLLDYSRVEQKLNEEHSEIIDGKTLMETVIALISPPEGFTIKATNDLSRIHVHRMPLQQVLYNLIQNAIKHHDKERGLIEVKLEETDSQYIFSVCDDGPGIPAEYHQKVFEMFQTLAPKSLKNGTGMGLALVKKLITSSGNDITLESEPGQGACFRFSWTKELKPGEKECIAV